jgi:hypothetical protein
VRVRSMSGASTDKRALHGSEVSSGPGPAGKKDLRASRACGEWRGGKEAAVRRGEGVAAKPSARRKEPSKCTHQRKRSTCKECGGASICPHQRKRSRCKGAGARASAPTSAYGNNVRSAGGRASARTSAGGANARIVGWGAIYPCSSWTKLRRIAVERQRSSDVSSFKGPYRHMYHRMCSQANPLSLDIGANVPVRQVEEEEEEEEEEAT